MGKPSISEELCRSGRASPDARLSDDETVAKMGHPIVVRFDVGHPALAIVSIAEA
jgi:hypothetical protein